MTDDQHTNAVLQAIEARSSCRQYGSDPVPESVLHEMLEAGRQAPSGANQQPWRLVVIQDSKTRQDVRRICEEAEAHYHAHLKGPLQAWLAEHEISPEKVFLSEAPALIAVFYDPKAPYAVPSVWIAISFMMLAAQDAGYATLPYTPPGPRLHELLGVDERLNLACVLPVGVCQESTRKPRKPISELATWI